MNKITFGRLLDGSPAEIKLSDAEVQAFDLAETYQSRLLILRRAAFRMRMVSMLLTDGHLVSNLNCQEPGPGEELVWLRSGEFGEVLDHSPSPHIELGSESVRLLSVRGGSRPIEPDTELLAWLDPVISVTAKDLAECMGVSRSEVQRRLTAMCAIGLARRNGPSDRHNPVRWYLTEDPAA